MRSFVFHIIICLLIGLPSVFAQSVATKFGKNRVQYHDDFNAWDKYETENFIAYWYGKSRNIGHAAVQIAELDHDEIQRILEHRINDKLEIIVYADLSDQKQTNIGNEEAFHSDDGQTKIVGNKMFVYFDGDHQNLRNQIREGIAGVYINSILFGSNLQEQVQNAILLRLPDWFKKGLVSYAGSSWDNVMEDELRDILNSDPERYLNFEKLARDYPKVAGHSLWYYLDQMYGKANIANLVYLTRINRKLEESFYYILGIPFDQIVRDWSKFYQDGFQISINDEKPVLGENAIKIKNKRNLPFARIDLSPSGDKLLYVLNDKGKYFVHLLNLKTNKNERLFKFGTKNIFQETDLNYPIIKWHPSERFVTILYEHKDVKYIREIDVVDGEVKETTLTTNYQRVYDIDYIDSETYMLNAAVDGYSDLFTFSVKSRATKRLTEDFYDDLDARVARYNNKKGILFSSNRDNLSLEIQKLDTILPLAPMNIFFLTIEDDQKDQKLIQLSNTTQVSERDPLIFEDGSILFLSPHTGVNSRFVQQKGKQYQNSGKRRNILLHSASNDGSSYAYTQKVNGKNHVFFESLDLNMQTNDQEETLVEDELEGTIPYTPDQEDEISEGYKFQSKYGDPTNIEEINTRKGPELEFGFEKYFSNYFSESVQDGKRVIKFSPMRIAAARLQFRWFDITTRLDNEVLFEGLESYTGDEKDLTSQPLGILFQTEVKDIFEDYNITTGIRIPTSFNGNEAFMVFDNDKKLFDHRFGMYRRAKTTIVDADFLPIIRYRRNQILGLYRIKYPFDVYRAVSLTTSLRFDKYFFLSADQNTLNAPQDKEKRLSAKLEYIFDNSFEVNLNIRNGTRYKVFLEAINQFDLTTIDGFEFTLSNGFTSILGFDFRHYIPILRYSVLALRGTGAASFGSNKMLYYLGGVESSFFSQFDQNIPVPPGNFAFKALAPHLRGFDHNIRNGSNYLLSNIELRIPVMKMLGLHKVKLGFFRDLQVVGFFDTGLAWHGPTPFSDNNPINNSTLERPPVIVVNVKYFRDPLVSGYGFGFRSTLLGYFLKLDIGRGIETREVQRRKIYLSIGKDF